MTVAKCGEETPMIYSRIDHNLKMDLISSYRWLLNEPV